MTARPTRITNWGASALVGAVLLVAGCDARVRDAEPGAGADVDIRTPLGALSVRTGRGVPDTGLPVYAGARPLSDEGEAHNANVSIDTPLFGLQVTAAKFRSPDTPAQVLAFYRAELRKYGDVVECHGEVDFRGRGSQSEPRCRERRLSREVHLVVGSEDHHRMVGVKTTRGDTEFSLVHVDARTGDW